MLYLSLSINSFLGAGSWRIVGQIPSNVDVLFATFSKPVMKLLEALTYILVNRVLKTLIVVSLSTFSA